MPFTPTPHKEDPVAYDNLTSRTDAAARIPERVVNDILGKATEESAVLTLFRRVPVSSAQTRMPILSALPVAYWVTGDTGLKQTTELAWANKYLNVEEIAVILPIPNNVADDIDFNIWDEAKPLLSEAVGRVLDTAVFFGTNAPSSFPTNIAAAAAAAGNTNAEGNTAAQGGFFGDIDEAIALIEADGYDMNGIVARTSAKSKFRGARNADGDRIDAARIGGDLGSLDGARIVYTMRGLWPATIRLFVGDFNEFVVGIRKDVTFEMFREGVIQDQTGAIIFNLMQQDTSAMRLTFRAGWQVSNRINNEQAVEANRYPVASLTF
jgi:HK97 family phage major capsid protein